MSGARAERKTERSGPKIGCKEAERAGQKTMKREREEAERKRNGERAESAAHSPLQSNILLTS